MTFSDSVSPDITEGIPTPLSRAQEASQVFAQQNIAFDVAVAGIPFLMAENDQNPYLRETAPFQKQQIDTTREAGEQTLDGYWIRSQTSWDKGAGIRFLEPTLDPESADRFDESLGVDVWEKGKISLLRSMSASATVTSGQTATVTGGVVGGLDTIFANENGTVKRRNTSATTYTGVTNAAGKVALAGTKILVGRPTSIASGDATGSSLADLWTGAASTPTPYWVKSRIIASVGDSLWELTLAGGSWPATALFQHPDASWTWSSVAEGPNAIYASGYSNGVSSIYAFKLVDAASGTVPELGQGYQVIELPLGEEIHSIHVALGTFMGIGTSKGFRVAAILDSGNLAVGPLLFETDKPIRAIASGDRFFYGAVENGHPDGKSGAFRVDLSQQIGNGDTLRFPYAWDARTNTTGVVSSVALYGKSDRVAIGVTGAGVYLQSATALEASGYLTTGRIRYGSVVEKAFRLLSVTETSGKGKVTVSSVDPLGTELYLRSLTSGANGQNLSLAQMQLGEFCRFKLLLETESGEGPTIESIQVRALPAPQRQRLVQFPLLCVDYPQSAIGVKFGHEGYAIEVLQALEFAEENFVVVNVQDFSTGENYQATVEQISFRRPGPKSTDGRKNFGGYINLTVRKL
jgi:hypothetical protein